MCTGLLTLFTGTLTADACSIYRLGARCEGSIPAREGVPPGQTFFLIFASLPIKIVSI